MEICCDLEVDVNGEETFMVDKVLLMLYFSISLFPEYLFVFLLIITVKCHVY